MSFHFTFDGLLVQLVIGELKEQYERLRSSSARLEDHLPRADTQ